MRVPMHINVEVSYNDTTKTIYIHQEGEIVGEVFFISGWTAHRL